jgi:hypothetical protein
MKVICIDASDSNNRLKEGKIYHVFKYYSRWIEVRDTIQISSWYRSRFEEIRCSLPNNIKVI